MKQINPRHNTNLFFHRSSADPVGFYSDLFSFRFVAVSIFPLGTIYSDTREIEESGRNNHGLGRGLSDTTTTFCNCIILKISYSTFGIRNDFFWQIFVRWLAEICKFNGLKRELSLPKRLSIMESWLTETSSCDTDPISL